MIPRYEEFAPRAELAAHVRCVWLFEGDVEAEDQRIAPDGCSELIVHFRQPYLERAPDGSAFRQASVVFAGQLTRPLHLRAAGPAGVIGVRFHPAGAWGYLGEARSEWSAYDASELVQRNTLSTTILIDQGLDDPYLAEQLHPHLFEDACRKANQAIVLRRHQGYDHGYYFIQTFIADHVRHHARQMSEAG